MDYKTLVSIKEKYNETEQEVIKGNIKHLMKLHKVKHSHITELLDISQHTSYSYTNPANVNKPELYNLMILAYYFNIDIVKLFKPL